VCGVRRTCRGGQSLYTLSESRRNSRSDHEGDQERLTLFVFWSLSIRFSRKSRKSGFQKKRKEKNICLVLQGLVLVQVE
jgi:hypothetical protein